jgi:HlyD family secretion protein
MKKRVIAYIVIAVTAASLGTFLVLRRKENGTTYKTDKIIRGDIENGVTATGTVNAVKTVLVGTQVSGTIKQIYVDFNSPIKRGQLLARIDPTSFEAQVAQAKANLSVAQANLEKAQASLMDAERTAKRYKELFDKELIAQSDLDTADVNVETAKAQVSASKAQISQAEAALKLTETNLEYTKILSPIDGIVISKNVDVGQTVAASFQTPTLFTIAQDLTRMQIDTNVDEADIGQVSVGQDVKFTVDAYPDVGFNGKVWQVRNAPITVQNVVTYDVVVQVSNPELKLKPGMTTNVSIVTARKSNVLEVPNGALKFFPREKNTAGDRSQNAPNLTQNASNTRKGSGVWVLEKGVPKRVAVSIGMSDESYSELLSGNLAEGQEVIVGSISKETKRTRPPGFRMF